MKYPSRGFKLSLAYYILFAERFDTFFWPKFPGVVNEPRTLIDGAFWEDGTIIGAPLVCFRF